MKSFTLNQILAAMNRLGYQVFEADTAPHNLNLVGIRSATKVPNLFNDQLWVFWHDKGNWVPKGFPLTTDPGLYWLEHPENINGTAIVKPGQYLNIWEIGLHKGQYEALVQVGPCTVIRDYNRDDKLDYNSGREESGVFGINLHHAGDGSQTVDKWSAGCQVLQNLSDYYQLREIWRQARNVWGNSFSYTLLREEEI